MGLGEQQQSRQSAGPPEAAQAMSRRPLWPGLPAPWRQLAGLALLALCLWLPAFLGLFLR